MTGSDERLLPLGSVVLLEQAQTPLPQNGHIGGYTPL